MLRPCFFRSWIKTISLSPFTCLPPVSLYLEHQACVPRQRQFRIFEVRNWPCRSWLGIFQTAVLGRLRPAITRLKPEEIVSKLRQVEVLMGQGMSRLDAIRQIGVVKQTYYRWCKQYGGMGVDQLKELKRLQEDDLMG